jgi:hypothetical protein
MADTKITALAAITTVDPAADVLPIVDISDTSMAASGTTKKITSNQILGAGGTATLASATITGDLTVDTSTLKVDSTNNRVGIGTATPTAALDVFGVFGTATAAAVFRNNSAPNNSNIVESQYFLSNSSGGLECAAKFGVLNQAATGNNYGTFYWQIANAGSPTEAMRLNSTGNLVLKGGTAGANGVGVTFPATQVASSDANCLDDYEEGTFTPGVTFGGASVGMVISSSGRYTKVGRAVTVSGLITITTRGTSTGTALITGLPFTSAAGDYVAASLRLAAISFTDAFQGYVGPSATTINLEQITNAGTESALTHSNFSVGSSFLIWNFTYTV